jgi:hypothetical protein
MGLLQATLRPRQPPLRLLPFRYSGSPLRLLLGRSASFSGVGSLISLSLLHFSSSSAVCVGSKGSSAGTNRKTQ